MNEWKFAMHETELLSAICVTHKEVTDVLFTGGDPMIMKTKMLAAYIDAILRKQYSAPANHTHRHQSPWLLALTLFV
jgi:L-lysine 2,3-aminomutase